MKPVKNLLGFTISRNDKGELIATDPDGKEYSKDAYKKVLHEINSGRVRLNKETLKNIKIRHTSEVFDHALNVEIVNELERLRYADDDESFWHDLEAGRL